MTVLQMHNVDVTIDSKPLVKSVNCSLEAGEILAIIGPNGAGKSSLLKSIINDIPVSNGEICINGDSLPTSAVDKLRARQQAILPQFSLLNFPYTVAEVVALGRIPHQTGHAIDQGIIEETLTAMDMQDFRHRLYPELSGGEKQRVQIARVLTQIWRIQDSPQPRLLLLDEPTTALDLGHQQMLMQCLRQFAQQQVAIVMVLHDVNLASRYADYLLALSAGRVATCGSAAEVLTPENLQQLFAIDARIIEHPETRKPVVLGI
ncbi:MAG: heme ABC transporter ATP-binding protein [Arenicella sp.]